MLTHHRPYAHTYVCTYIHTYVCAYVYVWIYIIFKIRRIKAILTVNCPLGVSGGSQVITMVDDDKGRTCTLRGALSISENDRKERSFHYYFGKYFK